MTITLGQRKSGAQTVRSEEEVSGKGDNGRQMDAAQRFAVMESGGKPRSMRGPLEYVHQHIYAVQNMPRTSIE
jgi:hypothetical protein